MGEECHSLHDTHFWLDLMIKEPSPPFQKLYEKMNGKSKIEQRGLDEALDEISHSLVGRLFCKGTQTVFL